MQKLTATTLKQIKAKNKPYKLADGGGLYLLIQNSGKYWRYKYRFLGKEKLLALGKYPEISLADARKAHQRARDLLMNNIDPSSKRKIERTEARATAANTFENITSEWLNTRSRKSESTEKRQKALLEKDRLPQLGKQPIDQITAPELLKALRKIESRGVVDGETKTNARKRVVPIVLGVEFIAEHLPKALKWLNSTTESNHSHKIKKLLYVATGNDRLTGHCCRHTFKANCDSNGVSPTAAATIAGWSGREVGFSENMLNYGTDSLSQTEVIANLFKESQKIHQHLLKPIAANVVDIKRA